MKHRVLQGSILGPLLFIIYIHDLPRRIDSISEPTVFADDTSCIIPSRNFEDFCSMSNLVLSHMIKMVCCQQVSPKYRWDKYYEIHNK